MMNPDEIKAFVEQTEAVCKAAPTLPWVYVDDGFDGYIAPENNKTDWLFGGEPCEGRIEGNEPETLFVLAASTALPRALEIIKEQAARIEELERGKDNGKRIDT